MISISTPSSTLLCTLVLGRGEGGSGGPGYSGVHVTVSPTPASPPPPSASHCKVFIHLSDVKVSVTSRGVASGFRTDARRFPCPCGSPLQQRMPSPGMTQQTMRTPSTRPVSPSSEIQGMYLNLGPRPTPGPSKLFLGQKKTWLVVRIELHTGTK